MKERLVEIVARALCREQCLAMRNRGQCATETGACLIPAGIARVATAALAALEEAGYAVVPVEPTAAMCECGPLLEHPITTSQADRVWSAMLASLSGKQGK